MKNITLSKRLEILGLDIHNKEYKDYVSFLSEEAKKWKKTDFLSFIENILDQAHSDNPTLYEILIQNIQSLFKIGYAWWKKEGNLSRTETDFHLTISDILEFCHRVALMNKEQRVIVSSQIIEQYMAIFKIRIEPKLWELELGNETLEHKTNFHAIEYYWKNS